MSKSKPKPKVSDWDDFKFRKDLPDVSRLADGRLFFMGDEGNWKVFEDGEWKDPKGITLGMVTDSKPLRNSEIEDLMERGMLPQ